MRKNLLMLVSALAAITLGACSGGGGSGSPVPRPSAKPSGLSVRITVTGRGQSSGAASQSALRQVLDTAQGEPVEESIKAPCAAGSPNCNSIAANSYFDSATAKIVVVDANGSPVPQPTPVVTLADPNATLSPATAPTNDPSTWVTVKAATTQPASTTLTARYPSGTLTGSLGVRQFPFAGFEAPTVADVDAAVAYTLQGPFLVPQSTTAGADAYLARDANNVMTLFAPGGYQVLGAGQAIGLLSTVMPFASAGTSLPLSSLATNPVVVVKAAQGFIAFKFGVLQCSYSNAPSACDLAGMAGAIYNTADLSGMMR